jgi:uncharacterized protein YecT (DUF1311 family)
MQLPSRPPDSSDEGSAQEKAMTIDTAAGRPAAPASAQRDDRPPWRQPRLVGGAAAIAALGLLLGLAMRPEIAVSEGPTPMQPVTPPVDGGQMDIVVNAQKPPAPVQAAPGKLEVLPPDMAAAAPRAVVPAAPARRFAQAPRASEPEPLVAPDPLPRLAEVSPRERVRPSFECRDARTRAEAIVCNDPALAAADRRMNQAFRRAVRSGAPYDQLRGEQDDFLSIREQAARRSPEAVASIYAQRIDELDAMAQDEW